MRSIFFALVVFLAPLTLQAQNLFAGGRGIEANPFAIGTAAQLAMLAQKVNAGDAAYNGRYYKLVADIDLSEYCEANTTFNEGRGWIPIGTYNNRFEGHFDGNGKKITGLFINNASLDYVGLFGVISGTVKNLGVENVNVTGNSRVGGLAGSVFILNGKIANCYTTGTVKGHNWVGGLVGEIFSGSIVTNCYSTCTVVGNQSVGGIAGAVFDTGRLHNSFATGTITSNIAPVGGIAGFVHPENSQVTNCVALNTKVTSIQQFRGTDRGVGRVVGSDANTLKNNFACDLIKDRNNQTTSWEYAKHDRSNGANVGVANFMTAFFWKTTVGFDERVWKIVDGKLPVFNEF